MTVYVDTFQARARVGRGRPALWSHMIADTREELHDFAARLGLRRAWFQDPTVSGKPLARPGSRHAENWHYDVTESLRKKALRMGAVEITPEQLVAITRARWETHRTDTQTTNENGERR